jgi:hypothetical protein
MGYEKRLWVGVWARGGLYLWAALQLVLFAVLALSLSDTAYAQAAAGLVVVALLLGIATAIPVWIWMYRAMAIAHEIVPSLTISPGWAVGWYFVPIASLWKPYEAMSEISEGSQSGGPNWDEVVGSLIGWWWAMWLIRTVTNGLSSVFGVTILLVSSIAGIAAAVLLAEIIRRITARYAHAVDASIFA